MYNVCYTLIMTSLYNVQCTLLLCAYVIVYNSLYLFIEWCIEKILQIELILSLSLCMYVCLDYIVNSVQCTYVCVYIVYNDIVQCTVYIYINTSSALVIYISHRHDVIIHHCHESLCNVHLVTVYWYLLLSLYPIGYCYCELCSLCYFTALNIEYILTVSV